MSDIFLDKESFSQCAKAKYDIDMKFRPANITNMVTPKRMTSEGMTLEKCHTSYKFFYLEILSHRN